MAILRRALWVVFVLAAVTSLAAQQYDQKLFSGMKWRLVGPFRGGRVLAVTGVVGQPNTYYFGAVAGGVWKTTDGGSNWTPLFDKEAVSSIGAIAVAQSDANVIYVGSGEACIRGNISYGDGVYKSTDAGKHWKNLGLKDSRHIGAVIVDPKDPDRVFVAALGHAYGPNSERGIFRSTNGGQSWEKVLYVNDKTGGIDVVFDPANPRVLFASMWEVVRTPWSLSSGGPGSGLYKSIDGGTTWKKLEGSGLPKGIWGRIGVTVSGADSNRVYALIEAEEGGIYRSDDSGDTWTKVNDDERYRQRAWYFSHIFADPKSADTVYVENTGLFRSADGGKSFTLLPAPHGDHHGLWIDPTNPQRIINGNDGGATISVDGGATWTRQDNQPTAQFYHVAVDNHFPYWLYGAQQDNSTVGIASRGEEGVIARQDWYDVAGGESGYIVVDPRDHNIIYAGSGTGYLTRYDKKAEQIKEITVWPLDVAGRGAFEMEHRFQWTEPVLLSPHDPDVLYTAGEMVFKSTDHGMSWTSISPDLTRNDKSKQQPSGGPITLDITSVEYYDTVFSLTESPVQRDLLWAGTDDGLVHVTQDGGKTWQNVTPKGMPEWSLISQIDASTFDAGTAYVAVERHRLDDFKPYAYKTGDFGKTWTKITTGIPDGAFVRAVRQDPKRKGLLYAGTELGIYVSFDDGARWQPLQLNLPNSPVTDLVVKDDDLVVSTNGRAFWILDNLTPLRQVEKAASAEFTLYAPAAAYRLPIPGWVDKRRPVGENPPGGAILDYYFKSEPAGEATLEITDAQGNLVRKYSSKEQKKFEQPPEWPDLIKPAETIPAKAGMNRFSWNLRYDSPVEIPGAFYAGNGPEGPMVVPGMYKVTMTAGGATQTASLEIKPDPRVKASAGDMRKQLELALQVRDRIHDLHIAVNQMRDLRSQLLVLKRRLADKANGKPVLDAAAELDRKITAIEGELIQIKMKSSEGNLRYPSMLNEQFDSFRYTVEAGDGLPPKQVYEVYDRLSRRLDAQLAAWKALVAGDVAALSDLVRKQDVAPLEVSSGTP